MASIEPGEKFACLASSFFSLAEKLQDDLDLGYGCWALPGPPVPVESQWQSWIGEIEAKHIRESNLVLFAKIASATPGDLDGENYLLENRVEILQWGLIIAGGVPAYDHGVILTGGNPGDGPRIRRMAQPQRIYVSAGTAAAQISPQHLIEAAAAMNRLEEALQQNQAGKFKRMIRGTNALVAGLRAHPADVRLHQFVRAVEGLLPPGAWRKDAFVEHAVTFVSEAPDPIPLLRELYQLRNIAEHHGDLERGLPNVAKGKRIQVATRRARQAEALARAVYRRAFTGVGHFDLFRDEESITHFWNQPPPARRAIWGDGFEIHAVA